MTLIEKLEKATGPSQELDAEIAIAVGVAPPSGEGGWWRCKKPNWQWKHAAHEPTTPPWEPARYTSSIDAALTLVPEGLDEEMKRARHRKGWRVNLWEPSRVGQSADAQTLPLALCIAALKARAYTESTPSPAATGKEQP